MMQLQSDQGLGERKKRRKSSNKCFTSRFLLWWTPMLFFIFPFRNRSKRKENTPTILTPHPGEMARLVDTTIAEVEANRFSISRQYAVENGVYLVLVKVQTRLLQTPDGKQYVNTTGNADLRKGGTGDTLTGIIPRFYYASMILFKKQSVMRYMFTEKQRMYARSGAYNDGYVSKRRYFCTAGSLRSAE